MEQRYPPYVSTTPPVRRKMISQVSHKIGSDRSQRVCQVDTKDTNRGERFGQDTPTGERRPITSDHPHGEDGTI
ncbi:hypothetical protein M404DRAFT_1003620 [Pisolithus tinctorius Marx 270]|uniref:Uncharacterized protein n=1 Tax=Pisolithus tinctorius Marx 270 TaxID=870435 RepID=A0A0C3NZB2_PISTI|nr:hypothetical protein M404DRAFT_1003620 [Pisolithus tinctorius Marx 270]